MTAAGESGGTAEGGATAPAPMYVSSAAVRRAGGPDKRVTLPAESEPVVMGVHDELAAFVGAADHPPRATTLDYVVGATAACLAGTFARALTARGVVVPADDHETTARGDVVKRGDVPVLERIAVRHKIVTAAEHHDVVRRVHDVYHRACPVSRSLEAAIEIHSELELEGDTA